MTDINEIVTRNIMAQMKAHKTKQTELADAIGVTKQTMSKMLNGSRLISIAELQKIANYFHVRADLLMKAPSAENEANVIRAFKGEVGTEAARKALSIADELADMIIFHARVRENTRVMSDTWEM